MAATSSTLGPNSESCTPLDYERHELLIESVDYWLKNHPSLRSYTQEEMAFLHSFKSRYQQWSQYIDAIVHGSPLVTEERLDYWSELFSGSQQSDKIYKLRLGLMFLDWKCPHTYQGLATLIKVDPLSEGAFWLRSQDFMSAVYVPQNTQSLSLTMGGQEIALSIDSEPEKPLEEILLEAQRIPPSRNITNLCQDSTFVLPSSLKKHRFIKRDGRVYRRLDLFKPPIYGLGGIDLRLKPQAAFFVEYVVVNSQQVDPILEGMKKQTGYNPTVIEYNGVSKLVLY